MDIFNQHSVVESSRLGSNREQLLAPCRDRVQSLPQGVSVRRSICSESTPVVDGANYRPRTVHYGQTALARHADDIAQAGINQEFDAGLIRLTGDFPVPSSRPSGYTNRSRMVPLKLSRLEVDQS